MVAESNQEQLRCTDGIVSEIPPSISEQLASLLKDGADVPLGSGMPAELPSWFDYEKFRRGQQFFSKNYYALFVSKLCGLLVVLAIPSILRVLILSQQSSDPAKAFRRYLDTISLMLEWYSGDLLEPTSGAYLSLRKVRGLHCAAARKASRAGIGTITQRDMALTQFGFMGFGLLAPEKLGIKGSIEDEEGFVHFWRTMGHLLGIEERFNLCRKDAAETRALCRAVLQEVIVPSLETPPLHFPEMTQALLYGMWHMIPFLEYDAFMSFTYDLAGIEYLTRDSRPISVYSRSVWALQRFVSQVLLISKWWAWIFRPFLNFMMWLAVYLTERYPVLAIASFGKKQIM
ncbi:uncharacterized protein [Anabrus simplex]|uniref:uncharacterized protein n=1 Tax=Anabrus simplex TaxID=316456 RepID=UPI0034DCEF92